MAQKKKLMLFLVTIEIIGVDSWFILEGKKPMYKTGDRIQIPVFAKSEKTAYNRVEKHYWGSEYPEYVITSITNTDDFLFKPIISFTEIASEDLKKNRSTAYLYII